MFLCAHMNWLTLTLYYFLNIRNINDFIKIKNVYFLENNFWPIDRKKSDNDDPNLKKIAIFAEGNRDKYVGYCYDQSDCFYLNSNFNNTGYLLLEGQMTDKIKLFRKSLKEEKHFLRFHFFFNVMPTENCANLKKENEGLITFKMFGKKLTNSFIDLKSDEKEIYKHHIKERFLGFLYIGKILKLEEYISKLNRNKSNDFYLNIEKNKRFTLYHFENYSECLKSLRKFFKNLCYFKLVENVVLKNIFTEYSDIYSDIKTTITISQFTRFLEEKFNVYKRKMNNYCQRNRFWTFISKTLDLFYKKKTVACENIDCKHYKYLFDRCFNHLIFEMIEGDHLFLIDSKYDIDFYLKTFCDIIYNLVKSKHEIYDNAYPEQKRFILNEILKSLDYSLEEVQACVIKNLCESEYFYKHFSNLLEIKIETLHDYIKTENVVCDYYNMFVYITNSINIIKNLNDSCELFDYFSPVFIDKYKLRIVNGIEIKFEYPAKLKKIKAFDYKGNNFSLKKNVDFFIDKFNRLYYIPEVLKIKNIHTIELISTNNRFNKKIKVDKRLGI